MTDALSKTLPENIIESMKIQVAPQSTASVICLYNFESSSIAADTVSSYIFSNTGIQIHTLVDRVVPAWVKEDVDVIIMSYSGDSPEVEAIYSGAKAAKARIHCITSGGKLRTLCEENGSNLLLIPSGMSNMDATGFEIGALVCLYEAMGVTGIRSYVEGIIPDVQAYRDSVWGSKDVWKLAVKLNGKIPAIYCTGELRAVHKRWKMLINQVIGKLAFSGEIPEFDHNEIIGWTESKHASNFVILFFKTETESTLLNTIVSTVYDLMEEYKIDVTCIQLDGKLMERGLRGIILADAVIECMKGVE